MKKIIIKIFVYAVIALTIYSFIPVIGLYLAKDPTPYSNAQAIEKLKGNTGEVFSFVAFSDNHSGLIFSDSGTLKLIKNMNREDRFRKMSVDMVINAGDVTFRGSMWDYKIFNRVRSLIKWPVICAMGNHDDDSKANRELFKQYVGKSELSFANRNSYFIILNNTVGEMPENRLAWLEKELIKSAAYKHRFVIMHKAPISSYQQSWFRPETTPWPIQFMRLCEKYKVDMVLSGHEHMYKDRIFGSVTYITDGSAGIPTTVPAWDGGILDYVVVRVYHDYVDYEVRKIFPPFWEYVGYYMWKDLFYSLKGLIY